MDCYNILFAFLLGIKIVLAIRYEYMDVDCGQTITVNGDMRLKLTSLSSYRPNMDCVLKVKVADYSSRLMFFFKDFSIENSCNNDWLEVRDGSSSSSSYISGKYLRHATGKGLYGHQCGFYQSSSTIYTTTSNYLYLRFVSDNSLAFSGFDMVITSYHTGYCYSYEYSCGNGRCISKSLTCNGYNPCGDYSDCAVVLTVGGIAGIVVGAIFFVVVVTILVIVLRRRRMGYVGRAMQPANVNVITTSNGYNQPIPQQYAPPQYPVGQQYPQPQPYPQY